MLLVLIMHVLSSVDLLLLQRGRQGLLELLGFVLVRHDQGVEIAAAPDLELGLGAVLLDLHGAGILSAGNLEELADLGDLLRHGFEFAELGSSLRRDGTAAKLCDRECVAIQACYYLI